MDGISFFTDLNLLYDITCKYTTQYEKSFKNNFRLRQNLAVDTHLPSNMIVQKTAQKNVTLVIGVCILAEKKNGDLIIHCAFHATTVKTNMKS